MLLKIKSLLKNPHFWAIVFITIALLIIYYPLRIKPYDSLSILWYLEIFEYVNDLNGFLFLIPFFYTAAIFKLKGAIIGGPIFMLAMIPRAIYFSPNPESLVKAILFFMIPQLTYILIRSEYDRRKREKLNLANREIEQQLHMLKIIEAQEKERQRISQELHDDTIQKLMLLANNLDSTLIKQGQSIHAEVIKSINSFKQEILVIASEIRKLCFELRPSVLDNIGLVSALRWQANLLNKDTGIQTEIMVVGQERRLKNPTDIMLYRIVQEALTNIRWHSKANHVKVTAEYSENEFLLNIIDDGIGFDVNKVMPKLFNDNKLGIVGIQDRVKSMNGLCKINSALLQGTKIYISIPI